MGESQRQLIRQGYSRAQSVTRAHAKSFYFASFVLFGARRRAAFALYSFCRRLDDMVDGPPGDKPDAPSLKRRLAQASELVASLYMPGASRSVMPSGAPWHEDEFAALVDTLRRYHIPQEPFQDLIRGMEMDLTQTRYANFAELDLYCYRVAGTVGLLMAPVLGCEDERALQHAADLGRGMQLTNILRDVKEDLDRGRCYLPLDELQEHGLTPETLQVGESFTRFLKPQIARARAYYVSALEGVPALKGFGAQRMTYLMAAIYSHILDEIEARDYDVLSGRAYVTGAKKLSIALKTLVAPKAWAMPESLPKQRVLT